jgi:hypothetical protein
MGRYFITLAGFLYNEEEQTSQAVATLARRIAPGVG